jgi:membrane protein DedA with SNARE-associated domain
MIEKVMFWLLGFTKAVISGGSYPGIVLLMAIESACIPLPSEIIMPFAGYLVFTGQFNLFWAATAGALGCNLGSVVAYEIGCYGGRPLVERYGRYIWLSSHDLDMAERFFQRFGSAAVFLGRLLPVIRTFIALPAGLARMPRLKFHIYTFAGSWPWCFALAWVGMKLGERWATDPRLRQVLHRLDLVIFLLLLGGAVWFVRSHWRNRMRQALNQSTQ